jgi:hypothetical protein
LSWKSWCGGNLSYAYLDVVRERVKMIAVKAIYDQGTIRFLEPLPEIERALVAVVFLETDLAESVVAAFQDVLGTVTWGEPMDEEGAAVLLALHEELAPYRLEAEESLAVEEASPV